MKKQTVIQLLSFRFQLFVVFFVGVFFISTSAETDTIKVGFEIDQAPFCFAEDSGQPQGFAIELFQAISNEMNFDIEFVGKNRQELENELINNNIDAIAFLNNTVQTEPLVDFTSTIFTTNGCILIRTEEKNISEINDLKGKKVAVVIQDNVKKYFNESELEATLVYSNSVKNALLELSNGNIDAVIAQKTFALHSIAQLNLTNIIVAPKPIEELFQNYSFAVKKNNTKLLTKLNKGLAATKGNGTYAALLKKWILPIQKFGNYRTRIIVGGEFNYPPYEYLDKNGQPTGFNVDLTKAIAKELGLEIIIKLEPWAVTKQGLLDNEIDIIQGMFYSVERDKIFNLTQAHSLVSHVIVCNKNIPMPANLDELRDAKIVVMKGDIMHDLLLENGFNQQIVLAETQEDVLKLVSQKKYNYALVAKIPALYWINLNKWNNLNVSDQPIINAEYCYASLHSNNSLIDLFSQGLSIVKEKGEYRKIYSKWLGVYQPQKFSFKRDYKYIIYFLTPLLIILFVIILWSQSLKRQVFIRTKNLMTEIEERRKIESELKLSQSKYKSLFENLENGFVLYELVVTEKNEENLIFVDANAAFEYLSGLKRKTFIGKSLKEVFQINIFRETKHWFEKFIKVAVNGKSIQFEDYIETFNLWFSVSAFSPGKNYVAVVIEDITERKSYEKKLKKAKEKAELSEKLKSAFLTNMSHEIRTPMNGILGFINLLRNPELTSEETKNFTDIINKSGERLLNTINDIIELSKIESGDTALYLSEINLNETLQYYISFFTPEANQKGLTLAMYIPDELQYITINSDKSKLDSILTNLIKNALKFTTKGSITFGCSIVNTQLKFFVSDTGKGIPKEKQKAIFDRFIQADLDITRGHEGSGLGLAICKGYTETLGGNIWVESIPGKGSNFYFTINFNPVTRNNIPLNTGVQIEKNTSEKTEKNRSHKKYKILIAEDDHTSFQYLKIILAQLNCEILHAINGLEAVNMYFDNTNLSLILMDVKMDVMDGIEATKQIRAMDSEIPIIAQTAYSMKEDINLIINAGCNDYVTKPIQKEKLFEKINNILIG